jgi:hypothetical protein
VSTLLIKSYIRDEPKSGKMLSSRNKFYNILEGIHQAGYTHRNLTLEALWVKGEHNSTSVGLTGFAEAVHKSDEPLTHMSLVRKDYKKLLELVPNLLRRKLEKDEEEDEITSSFRSQSLPLPERPSWKKSKLSRDTITWNGISGLCK